MEYKKKNFNGIQSAAEMFNYMDKASRDRLLDKVAQKNPEVAKKIREQMFVFEDLVRIEPRGLQLLLREVPHARWVVALRNAGEELKQVIFNNLSARAAGFLQEEISSQGPRKLSDVNASQHEIVQMAQKMIADGRISFTKGSI